MKKGKSLLDYLSILAEQRTIIVSLIALGLDVWRILRLVSAIPFTAF